jgi:hypothetical protein
MNTQDVMKQILELENQQGILDEKKRALFNQEKKLRSELAAYWAWQTYGLRVGDRITWMERYGYRDGKIAITIEITKFSSRLYDDLTEDTTPTINGVRILKDGTVGSKTDSWYSIDQNGKFTKVAK